MTYEQYKTIMEALDELKEIAVRNQARHGLRGISIHHERQADAAMRAARQAFDQPSTVFLKDSGYVHSGRAN